MRVPAAVAVASSMLPTVHPYSRWSVLRLWWWCCRYLLCLQEKAQAQGFANALATIGKFVLKKKAGDKDQLYSA